jgi:hypothetical protein
MAKRFQPAYQEASERLQIELVPMMLDESAPLEDQRVFAEIAKDRYQDREKTEET